MKNTVRIKTNESKIIPIIWTGQKDESLDVNIILDSPGSSVKILGIISATKHRLKLRTNIIHKAPNTFSRTEIRGVLDGDASVDFTGLLAIEKGAKGADGDLKARFLLLSGLAKATAIPSLEVAENEVAAGHGASVGKIDEEQLFYIMSRGLGEKAAKSLITKGFLQGLLSEFPEKEAKKLERDLF